MTDIASENKEVIDSLIGNNINKSNTRFLTFFKTFTGGLGILISKAQTGTYVAIANDDSSSIKPDLKFSCSTSNCTADLNKWHVISVTWSNKG